MLQKVLIITYSVDKEGEIGNPGISDQVIALRRMGVDIDIWTIRVGDKSSYLKTILKTFLLNFQKKRYDLVHGCYSFNGLIARFQFISPVVVTLMGTDLLSKKPFYKKGGRDALAGKIICRLADEIIVQTPEMSKDVPGKKEHVHIIPAGINTDIFKPLPLEKIRQELGLLPDQKLVLFPYDPARTEKGFPLIKEAVDLLKPAINAQLVIIYGRPRDLLAKYMNACDAMVLASTYEGSPVAIREALACNLPVVSVDVGDVAYHISLIEGCYLCKHDAHDIANKLQLVFQRGCRINAQREISSMDFNWSANEILKIYHSMAGK